jgi:hypothetical protein
MQKRQNEAITCRFCLSEVYEAKNPFLSPCHCKGSIEFVHLLCLNKWRNRNIERNYDTCNLCHTDYIIPIQYSLEEIPTYHLICIVLEYPLITNFVSHYGWLIYTMIANPNRVEQFHSYYYFQGIYTSYYLFSAFLNFRVIKRRRYFQGWKKEYRFLFFALYGFSFYVASLTHSSLAYILPSFLLTMGWHLHIQILRDMNREDLKPSEDE